MANFGATQLISKALGALQDANTNQAARKNLKNLVEAQVTSKDKAREILSYFELSYLGGDAARVRSKYAQARGSSSLATMQAALVDALFDGLYRS